MPMMLRLLYEVLVSLRLMSHKNSAMHEESPRPVCVPNSKRKRTFREKAEAFNVLPRSFYRDLLAVISMSQDPHLKEGGNLRPGEMEDSWTTRAPCTDPFSTNDHFMLAGLGEGKCQTHQPAMTSRNAKEYGDYATDDKLLEVNEFDWVRDECTGFFDIMPLMEPCLANEQNFENSFCGDNLGCCNSSSTSNEYMTPTGSLFSMDSLVIEEPEDVSLLPSFHCDDMAEVFYSSLEVFSSSKPIPVPNVKLDMSRTPDLPTPPKSSTTNSTESINLDEDPKPVANSGDDRILAFEANYMKTQVQFYEQTVTILDISDQRVNFMNTTSAPFPIDNHVLQGDHLLDESYQDRILEGGYHKLDSSSSSLESRSTNGPTPDSSPHSSSCESSPILQVAQLQMTGNDTSTTSISQLLSMSAVKNGRKRAELRRQRADGNPHLQQNGLLSWTWLKKTVRQQFQAIRSRMQRKKVPQASKGPSKFLQPSADYLGARQLCEESLEDDGIDLFDLGSTKKQKKGASGRPCLRIRGQGDEGMDDNVSSDEFYTSSGKWDLKGMYQRVMSYMHNVCCRRS